MVVDLSHLSLDDRSNWPPNTSKIVLAAWSFCSCCTQLSCLLVLSIDVVAPAVSVVVYVVVIVTAAWLAFPGGTYMMVNGITWSCISATGSTTTLTGAVSVFIALQHVRSCPT